MLTCIKPLILAAFHHPARCLPQISQISLKVFLLISKALTFHRSWYQRTKEKMLPHQLFNSQTKDFSFVGPRIYLFSHPTMPSKHFKIQYPVRVCQVGFKVYPPACRHADNIKLLLTEKMWSPLMVQETLKAIPHPPLRSSVSGYLHHIAEVSCSCITCMLQCIFSHHINVGAHARLDLNSVQSSV